MFLQPGSLCFNAIPHASLSRVDPKLAIVLDGSSLTPPARGLAEPIPPPHGGSPPCPHVPQATTTVYVTVLDENDNAPAFQQQLYEVTLDEGPATLNATLVTVQALDLDEGPNGTVAYAITEGNILGTFHIDSATVSIRAPSPAWPCPSPSSLTPGYRLLVLQGQIRTLKELDYEISHGRYTLVVTATDQCPAASRRLTSTATVGLRQRGGLGVQEFPSRERFHISFPAATSSSQLAQLPTGGLQNGHVARAAHGWARLRLFIWFLSPIFMPHREVAWSFSSPFVAFVCSSSISSGPR